MRSCRKLTKHPTHSPGLDLEAFTEATRRALYDIVVAVHFTAPIWPGPDDFYPAYSPDQAGLVVWFTHGRWFAGWTMLEEDQSDLPAARRYELLRIQADPEAPYGVAFHEV
jgi:hypothetical protein